MTADGMMIGEHVLGIGGLGEVTIDLRILFQRVITDKCDKFVIAHNHTNGSGIFSDDDFKVALKIKFLSNTLGVEFMDSYVFPYLKEPSSMKKRHKKLWNIDLEKIAEKESEKAI
jgi:DNA repair protein RadC